MKILTNNQIKDSFKELRFAGKTAWNVYENENFVTQIDEADMRIGVVWREVCLKNAEHHAQSGLTVPFLDCLNNQITKT